MLHLKSIAFCIICFAILSHCGNVIIGDGNCVNGNNNILRNSHGNNVRGNNNSLEKSLRNQIAGDWNRLFATNDIKIHGHDHYFTNGK